jgi:hypothetical protein
MSEDNSPLGMARKEMDRTCFLCGEKGLHLFADWDEDLKCLTDYWFECDCCSGYQILVYDSLDELMAKLADIQSRRANRWANFETEELRLLDICLETSSLYEEELDVLQNGIEDMLRERGETREMREWPELAHRRAGGAA